MYEETKGLGRTESGTETILHTETHLTENAEPELVKTSGNLSSRDHEEKEKAWQYKKNVTFKNKDLTVKSFSEVAYHEGGRDGRPAKGEQMRVHPAIKPAHGSYGHTNELSPVLIKEC